jgi:hypothetical protein
MPNLAPCPEPIDLRFVLPDIKRGDYYLFNSPVTGRRLFVYPRMMGERYFPAVEKTGLGAEGTTPISDIISAISAIRPGEIVQEVETTRQEIRTATTLMKVLIAVNFVVGGLAAFSIIQNLKKG